MQAITLQELQKRFDQQEHQLAAATATAASTNGSEGVQVEPYFPEEKVQQELTMLHKVRHTRESEKGRGNGRGTAKKADGEWERQRDSGHGRGRGRKAEAECERQRGSGQGEALYHTHPSGLQAAEGGNQCSRKISRTRSDC